MQTLRNADLEIAMTKALIGALSLAAVSLAAVPAAAADLRMPTKAPVIAASLANWSGLYIGVHGGAQRLESEYAFAYDGLGIDVSDSRDFSSTSALFGAQAGYNWQVSPGLLFGIEADVSWADHSEGGEIYRYSVGNNDHFDGSVDLGLQGSIRARLGFINGGWLFYATGGAAFGDTSTTGAAVDDALLPAVTTTNDSTRWGWTAGAGVDVMLTPNWIAGIEYRYTDLGGETFIVTPPLILTPFPYPASADYTTHAVTFRLNYKFGG